MTGERYSLDGPAVPAGLEAVHELMARVGRDHPALPDLEVQLFTTALVEVAGNVAAHGVSQAPVRWRLDVAVRGDRLEATLVDTGDPLADLPPQLTSAEPQMPDVDAEHGRGIALARAVLDDLAYRRVGEENHWHLVRRMRTAS